MLWTVLFQKLKRQPPKASQIYALLDNPKTHRTEKVYLKLKYDSYCKYRPQKDLHFLFFTVFLILSVSDQ